MAYWNGKFCVSMCVRMCTCDNTVYQIIIKIMLIVFAFVIKQTKSASEKLMR